MLTIDQIKNKSLLDLSQFTSAQLAQLTNEQLAAVGGGNTRFFDQNHYAGDFLSKLYQAAPEKIRYLSAKLFEGFIWGSENGLPDHFWSSITTEQMAAVSVANIRYWGQEQITELTPELVGALTVQQIAAWGTRVGQSHTLTQYMTAEQIHALNVSQVAALNIKQVAAFTSAQLAQLTNEQLAAVGGGNTRFFDQNHYAGDFLSKLYQAAPEKIRYLSAKLFEGFIWGSENGLPDHFWSSITTEQMAAVSVANIRYWGQEQITELTPELVGALTVQQIAAWGTRVGQSHTLTQYMTAEQIHALNVSQVAALNIKQVAAFTSAQLAQLTNEQLAAVGGGNTRFFDQNHYAGDFLSKLYQAAPEKIRYLSAKLFEGFIWGSENGLPDHFWSSITTEQMAAVSVANIRYWGQEQITELTPELVGALTVQQIAAWGTRVGQSHTLTQYMTAEQIHALNVSQVAALNIKQVAAFTSAQLAQLTNEQLAAVGGGNTRFFDQNHYAGDFLSKLYQAAPEKIRYLSAKLFEGFIWGSENGLPDHFWSSITTEQMAAVSVANIRYWGQEQITELTPELVGALTVQQIAAWGTRVGQSHTLTQYMTAEQIHALNVSQVNALSLSQINAFSNEQVRQLTTDQLAGLKQNLFNAIHWDISSDGVLSNQNFDIPVGESRLISHLVLLKGVMSSATVAQVRISGLPSDAELTAGVRNDAGDWVLTYEEFISASLSITASHSEAISMGVEAIMRNGQRHASNVTIRPIDIYEPSDDFKPWYSYLRDGENYGIPQLWREGFIGTGVKIAVFDSGLANNHPGVNWGMVDPGSDLIDADPELKNIHGTAVYSIIAAPANGQSLIGIAHDAYLLVRNFISGGHSLGDLLRDAINNKNYDVVNNSWGMAGYGGEGYFAGGAYLSNALNGVGAGRNGLGTSIIFASGNSRGSGAQVGAESPGNHENAISVAAVNALGRVANFSSGGACVHISALGVGNLVSYYSPEEGKEYMQTGSGTSYAAPMVSATVGLMYQANEGLGLRDVQEILAYTARVANSTQSAYVFNHASDSNGGGLHYSNDYGFGILNALAAVHLSEYWFVGGHQAKTVTNREVFSYIPAGGQVEKALPNDHEAYVEYSFDVAEGVRAEIIKVSMDLADNDLDDLRITLIGPSGTTSILLDQWNNGYRDGSGVLVNGVIDLDAFTLQSRAFWGESATGSWKLRFERIADDDGQVGGGLVHSINLSVMGGFEDSDDRYVYTDEFNARATENSLLAILDDDDLGIDVFNAAAVTADVLLRFDQGVFRIGSDGVAGSILNNSIEIGVGGMGSDLLVAGSSTKELYGGRGNDTLVAKNIANDCSVLDGGEGDDILICANLGAMMTGGSGRDFFIVDWANIDLRGKIANITDYHAGEDLILSYWDDKSSWAYAVVDAPQSDLDGGDIAYSHWEILTADFWADSQARQWVI